MVVAVAGASRVDAQLSWAVAKENPAISLSTWMSFLDDGAGVLFKPGTYGSPDDTVLAGALLPTTLIFNKRVSR